MNRLTQKKQKARNFARAFLRVQNLGEQELFAGIDALNECSKKNPLVFHTLELSSAHIEEKYAAISELGKQLELPAQVCQLLCAVLKYKEFDSLSIILSLLKEEFKKMHGIHEVMIHTSHELPHERKMSIEKLIAQKIPGTLRCMYSLDPSLIAGIKIETPLYYWEHSVARTIRQLQQQLSMQEQS